MTRNLLLNRQVMAIIFVLLGLLVFGTSGYVLLEGWHWRDALFMTIITLSTVGYGEIAPLSARGVFFSMILIVLGVSVAAYTFSAVTDYIVAGELRGVIRRQRMTNAINKMHGHYVICGYGRVGHQVVEGLRANRFDIVVVDADADHVSELEQLGIHFVVGNAADDEVLVRAGIERASGMCTCLPDDATNVFAVLSARALNPDLYIVSRSNQPESEPKLRIAGANHVINPYLITGHRMAAQLLHPGAVEFLDVVMRRGDLELRIEEITIAAGSFMDGKTVADCHVRHDTGANILAVRRADGKLYTNVRSDFVLHAGDGLISLGTAAQLTLLAQRAGDENETLHMVDSSQS